MLELSATTEVLARAIDVCALRQAVYTANVANAGVDNYRRLDVRFDELEMLHSVRNDTSGAMAMRAKDASATDAEVVATQDVVKLDEEMAAMANNAMRYQMLLGLYQQSLGAVRMAVREGRGA